MYLHNNTSIHNMSDYYSILNVSHTASMNEIKSSFRKLSLQFHPDKDNSDASISHYNNIMTAYSVLEDESSRKKYDNNINRNNSGDNGSDYKMNNNLSALAGISSSLKINLMPSATG